MEKMLHVSSSPHVRDGVTTPVLMYDVTIAMLPAAAFGVYHFGFHALLVLLVTTAACVLSEYIYERLMGKPVTIKDGSAVITGMILALNMPPEIPLWIPVLGGVFAIIVVKQLYGGLGQNFMNPALAARCFLLISFAGRMSTFTLDGVTAATPLALMRSGEGADLTALFLGTIPGTIGEVSKLALLIGAAYLLIRRDGVFGNLVYRSQADTGNQGNEKQGNGIFHKSACFHFIYPPFRTLWDTSLFQSEELPRCPG